MRRRLTEAEQQGPAERQASWTLALAIMLSGSAAYAAEGDAVRGERVFERCYACHSVDPKETAKLQGPSLFQIIGRPAAAVAGFEYSEAMREKGAAGLIWDAATLDRYIANPEGAVPGTLMSAPPLRDEQERADLIAYLARSGRQDP
jgi:cytochrome c2